MTRSELNKIKANNCSLFCNCFFQKFREGALASKAVRALVTDIKKENPRNWNHQ